MLLGQRIVQGTGRSIRTEPVHHCRGAFSGCRTCQRDSTHARREEVPKARIGKHRRSEMHSAGIFPYGAAKHTQLAREATHPACWYSCRVW